MRETSQTIVKVVVPRLVEQQGTSTKVRVTCVTIRCAAGSEVSCRLWSKNSLLGVG